MGRISTSIRFGLWPLHELHFLSLANQGLGHLCLAAELVRDGARAVGDDFQQVLNGSSMGPAQHGVHIPHPGIQTVVCLGTDLYETVPLIKELAQTAAHVEGLCVA